MRTLFIITILPIFLFHNVWSQEIAGAAIVVNIKGEALCISKNKSKLKIGSVLVSHDSIYLSQNSTLTLLETDGKLNSYAHSFALQNTAEQNPIVQKVILQSLRNQNWLESVKKSPRNNFRSSAIAELSMVYPRNTRLRNSPDWLIWTNPPKADLEIEVSLRCYENDFSYDEITKNNNLRLASAVSISAKRQYYWFVRDVHAELSEIPSAVWFYVLDSQECQRLEDENETIISIMRNDTLSVAYQLLYANLLMSYELYAECKELLDVIVQKEPNNPVIYMFYASVFDKMDMINDSQKYIEYSDQFGN